MADLDAIVVTYNSEPWVDRLLGSVGDVRTIVVDNASADGTLAALARHDVEVIANNDNRYLSPAWNQGLELSDAPYVVLLNPDCEILTPGWDKTLAAFFEAHPDVGIIGPRLVREDGSPYLTGWPFHTKRWFLSLALHINVIRERLHRPKEWRWEPEWQRDTQRDVDVVEGACMVIRREMLDRIGGVDEGFQFFYEEDDLCFRARRAGYRVVFDPEVEIIHASGASRETVDPASYYQHIEDGFYRLAEKQQGRVFALLVRAIRRSIWRLGHLVSP